MKREAIDPAFLEEVKKCAESALNGGILIYPAETLWGIGCRADNPELVEKVKKIKQRPDNKALITLVSSYRMLQNVVADIPAMAEEILDMSQEPLTIIYPGAKSAFQHLTSEDGKIGVRMVEKGFAHMLIERSRGAMISTSANISGQPGIVGFDDIPEEIIEQADCIANPHLTYEMSGKASRVILVEMDGKVKVLR